MPNTKSAAKRVKVTAKKTLRNRQIKSTIRTAIRRYREALDSGNQTEAVTALERAFSRMDKAVNKGVIHKNKAARLKSRLSKRLTSQTG
ncbi:MAG: 30S ribosomal protein S20 [Limnochordia bacterium]